jgi:hypothetical protein
MESGGRGCHSLSLNSDGLARLADIGEDISGPGQVSLLHYDL